MGVSFDALLRGLGACNPAVADDVVEVRVQAACPRGTYTWIQVQTVLFTFPCGRESLSRLIEFNPTGLERVISIVKGLFYTPETLNVNRAAQGLLGSADLLDQEAARSASKNCTIRIFAPMDGATDAYVQVDSNDL